MPLFQTSVSTWVRTPPLHIVSNLLKVIPHFVLASALVYTFAHESVDRIEVLGRYSYNYLLALIGCSIAALGVMYVFGFNPSLRASATQFARKWRFPLLALTLIAVVAVAFVNIETRLQWFYYVLLASLWILAANISVEKVVAQVIRAVPLLLVWIALVYAFIYQSIDRIQVLRAYSLNYFAALLVMITAALFITRIYVDSPRWLLKLRERWRQYIVYFMVGSVLFVIAVWSTNLQMRLVVFSAAFLFAVCYWISPATFDAIYPSLRRNTPLGLLWLATAYIAATVANHLLRFSLSAVEPLTLVTLFGALALSVVITYTAERQAWVLEWLGARIAPFWQPLSALILAVCAVLWWQPLDTPIMVYVLVAVPSILTLILSATPNIDERRAVRFIGITAAVVGVVALGVQVYLLTYIPAGHYHDEGAYSHIAMLGMQTGRLGGDLYGFPPRNYIGFGNWLYTLGTWYEIFGFGWLSGRLYALVFGLGALAVLGWTIWRFIDRRAALFAVSMFAMSWLFVEARSIRPDTITLFFISVSLLCFLYALEKPQLWRFALCGFITALGFEAHLLIAAYWIAYGAVFGLQWLQDCLAANRWRFPSSVFAFGLASVPLVAFYFVSHFVPDMGLPSATVLSTHFDLWSGIVRELGRWQTHFAYVPNQFESFIIVLSIIALVIWGKERRFYVLLLVLVILGFAIVAPNNWRHYNRFFLPVFLLVMAAALSMLMRYKVLARFSMYAAMILCVSLMVFAGNIRDELLVRPDIAQDMASGALIRPVHPVAQYISDHVSPGDTVVAEMLYYLALDDPYRYVWYNSYINVLVDIREQMEGPNDRDLLKTWHPAVILLDQMIDPWHWGVRNPLIPAITDYVEDNGYVRVRDFEPSFLLFVRPDILAQEP